MKNKEKMICTFLGVVSFVLLIIIVLNGKFDIPSMLKASISDTEVQNNEVINAARKMAQDNINSLKEENVYTIKELIKNKYLTGNEVDPTTGEEYNENTRVVVVFKENKIEDIYLTNVLFKNKISCQNVCYLNFDNYIYFNNDVYRILKIDQQGHLYITNNKTKKLKKDEIDSYIKNLSNSYDKKIAYNVISLFDADIEKSNMLNLKDDIVVNTSVGYKLYNIDSNKVEDINKDKINILPIIVLNNNITYEKGNGSKFNPYVLGE